jgi:hypothetical protein
MLMGDLTAANTAAWNSREGAPLGRNHYLELEIKKTKPEPREHQALSRSQNL